MKNARLVLAFGICGMLTGSMARAEIPANPMTSQQTMAN
jgi:hypothetical protein